MNSESAKRAKAKYIKEKVKQVSVQFYPKDHELLEQAKKKASSEGGLNAYIKDLIAEDLRSKK